VQDEELYGDHTVEYNASVSCRTSHTVTIPSGIILIQCMAGASLGELRILVQLQCVHAHAHHPARPPPTVLRRQVAHPDNHDHTQRPASA
jgi:hypothetical protein